MTKKLIRIQEFDITYDDQCIICHAPITNRKAVKHIHCQDVPGRPHIDCDCYLAIGDSCLNKLLKEKHDSDG